jgi:hypothetical protein
MKKQILIIVITLVLIFVSLSGCNEPQSTGTENDNTDEIEGGETDNEVTDDDTTIDDTTDDVTTDDDTTVDDTTDDTDDTDSSDFQAGCGPSGDEECNGGNIPVRIYGDTDKLEIVDYDIYTEKKISMTQYERIAEGIVYSEDAYRYNVEVNAKNIAGKTLKKDNVVINLYYYDKNNNLVDETWTTPVPPDDLEPEEIWWSNNVEDNWNTDFEEIDYVEIEIDVLEEQDDDVPDSDDTLDGCGEYGNKECNGGNIPVRIYGDTDKIEIVYWDVYGEREFKKGKYERIAEGFDYSEDLYWYVCEFNAKNIGDETIAYNKAKFRFNFYDKDNNLAKTKLDIFQVADGLQPGEKYWAKVVVHEFEARFEKIDHLEIEIDIS